MLPGIFWLWFCFSSLALHFSSLYAFLLLVSSELLSPYAFPLLVSSKLLSVEVSSSAINHWASFSLRFSSVELFIVIFPYAFLLSFQVSWYILHLLLLWVWTDIKAKSRIVEKNFYMYMVCTAHLILHLSFHAHQNQDD